MNNPTAVDYGRDYYSRHPDHPLLNKMLKQYGEVEGYRRIGLRLAERTGRALAQPSSTYQPQPEEKPAPQEGAGVPVPYEGDGMPSAVGTVANFVPNALQMMAETAAAWTFGIDETLRGLWDAAEMASSVVRGAAERLGRQAPVPQEAARERLQQLLFNRGRGLFGAGDDMVARAFEQAGGAAGQFAPEPDVPAPPGPHEPALDAAIEAVKNIEGADVARAIQERPAELLTAITSPRALAQGLGASRLATTLGAANPLRMPVEAGSRALKYIKESTGAPTLNPLAGGLIPISALSGVSPGAYRQAFSAGRQQGTTAKRFVELMRGARGEQGKRALDTMIGHMSKLYDKRAKEWEYNLAQLQPKEPLEHVLYDLRRYVREALPEEKGWRLVETEEDFPLATAMPGSKDKAITPVTGGTVKKQVRLADEQPYQAMTQADLAAIGRAVEMIENWDWVSPQGLNQLQQNLWRIAPQGETDYAQKIIKDMHGRLRGQLGEKVYGYNEAMEEYKNTSELIKQLKYTLSLPVGHKEWRRSYETTINKLLRLSESNDSYAGELIRQMEAVTGEPFLPSIAGLSLAQIEPQGLIGRSQAWQSGKAVFQALSAGSMAGAGAFINPAFLGGLVFVSPRLGGEVVYAMGRAYGMPERAVRRAANRYERMLGQLEKKFPGEARAGRKVKDIIGSLDKGDALTYMAMLKEFGPGDEPALPSSQPAMRIVGKSAP